MLHKIGIMSALILGLAMPAAAECLIKTEIPEGENGENKRCRWCGVCCHYTV